MKFEQFLAMAIDAVKSHRNKLGLTQEQLAQRIGKQQSVIARFENGGIGDPRLSMFFDLCEGLDISPAEIFQRPSRGQQEDKDKVAAANKARLVRSKLKELKKTAKNDLELLDEVLSLV